MSGRTHTAVLSPQERIKNFNPYVSNLDDRTALYEAARCLMCFDAPCITGCPTGINIPEFIFRIKTSNYYGSAKVIRSSNVFGGECGYVCPVERLCEEKCVRNKLGEEPVAISLLQRFAYEKEKPRGLVKFQKEAPKNKRVAIVGAGPAGLSAAYELARKGYGVTVFDSNAKPGGLLHYGILPWKASWAVAESEIANIKDYGVKFVSNKPVVKVRLLLKEYGAVFIGTGSTKSSRLGIPGEKKEGVYLAQEFLESVAKSLLKEGKAPNMNGKRVAVIGGGDTAIDASMAALRLGAGRVYLLYRRTQKEMPAVPYGRKQAREEGVIFLYLTAPLRITTRKRGKALSCCRMELGTPDASGRRSVTQVKGSEFALDVDVVIVAVGQKPDEKALKAFGVKRKNGLIQVNESHATSIKGVFAGGDAVNGGETVVQSVAEGKKAAETIDKYLSKRRSVN
jgi:glutamate synthase (NADPH/NADH) small chain